MLHILILCTGNSCRSIIGEALINHLAAKRFRAFSAGSHPVGQVNPGALAILKDNGIPIEGLASKSWHEFDGTDIDIVITVCDDAAGEICPAYLKSVIKGHWSLPDPAKIKGSRQHVKQAFQNTFEALKKRITLMLAYPLEDMTHAEISKALQVIAEQACEAEKAD
jgi:arsenate reductase